MKHEVGLTRRPVEIYEIDETFFAEKFAPEAAAAEAAEEVDQFPKID